MIREFPEHSPQIPAESQREGETFQEDIAEKTGETEKLQELYNAERGIPEYKGRLAQLRESMKTPKGRKVLATLILGATLFTGLGMARGAEGGERQEGPRQEQSQKR